MSSEWPTVDSQSVPLPTIVSSSDLFDGELFGDELIDIYNDSIDDTHCVNNGEFFSALVELLSCRLDCLTENLGADASNSEDDHTEDILAAIDEGFSGFHPSSYLNSFLNETSNYASLYVESEIPDVLTQMVITLPSSSPDVITSSPAMIASASSDSFQTNTIPNSKKRSVDCAQPVSAPKRKATSTRRVSASKKVTNTAKIATGNAMPVSIVSANSKDLPNPLISDKDVHVPTAPKVIFSKIGGVTLNVKPLCQTNPPEMATSQPSVSRSPSESDFKELAQAAVSAFMAGASSDDASAEINFPFKVDTSTAHIKALTGNNWVAACVGNSNSAASVSSDVDDSKSNNRCKRQNLSADDRARQNRDRNREHARNTRLRKKAYVEELKHTLSELVTQRDVTEAEKRQSVQREAEQREVRFRVMEEFLKLRGRNETNSCRWAAILEDGFTLTVPSVEYKNGQLSILEKILTGASSVMEESGKFNSTLFEINGGIDGSVTFQYGCDRKDFFMDGSCGMMEWNGYTINSIGKIKSECLSLKGMMRAQFSPASNKLLSATLIFDASQIFIRMQAVISGPRCDSTYGLASANADRAANTDSIHAPSLMPCLSVSIPSAVMIVDNSSSSESSSEKGDHDSDESVSEHAETIKGEEAGMIRSY